MYKNLRFKIIIILITLTIVLMSVVISVLLISTNNFYKSNFVDAMDTAFDEKGEIVTSLKAAMESNDYAQRQNEILKSYISTLGINNERNYYILDMTGNVLAGSDVTKEVEVSENILSAMSKQTGKKTSLTKSSVDYALYLSSNNKEVIIYIFDEQTTASNLNEMFFQIIIQAIFIGIFISIVLSFFLSQAITDPIEDLTQSAEQISKGTFSGEIVPRADDEIGTLSTTFNYMKNALKNTLDEVSGERAKIETLFLYLNDAVLAFDSSGKLIHINKMAQTLFNTSENGDVSFSKLIKELGVDYTIISEGFKTNRNYMLSDVMYNGKVFDITFAEFKYSTKSESGEGIMCVIHDNTGRYELDKSRREFVADVSHELRTPLTSIKGALETIELNPDLDEETKVAFLDMAIEECDRMTRIVSDLLVLSRLDNNKTRWKISEYDVGDMINHVCSLLEGEVKAQNHKLTTNIQQDLPVITGDKEKIEQVLINIVTNSIKYTKPGGRIHIEGVLTDDPEYIEIAVTDSGVGIPEEDQSRVFERFYRVDKSRTNGAGGTGLGLAIAKEIVDAHGGNMKIVSQVGVGTRIAFQLPVKTKLETYNDYE